MNVASRVFFTRCAISSIAWSHEMSSQWSEPGRRTCGFSRRRSFRMSCSSDAPLGQSVPRLIGMIGIALDVHHLRHDVLRAVADGVNDDAATHRAVRTSAARFVSCGKSSSAEIVPGVVEDRSRGRKGRRLPLLLP